MKETYTRKEVVDLLAIQQLHDLLSAKLERLGFFDNGLELSKLYANVQLLWSDRGWKYEDALLVNRRAHELRKVIGADD